MHRDMHQVIQTVIFENFPKNLSHIYTITERNLNSEPTIRANRDMFQVIKIAISENFLKIINPPMIQTTLNDGGHTPGHLNSTLQEFKKKSKSSESLNNFNRRIDDQGEPDHTPGHLNSNLREL